MKKMLAAMLGMISLSANVHAAGWVEANDRSVSAVKIKDNGGFVLFLDTDVDSSCTQDTTKSVYFSAGQNNVTAEGIKSLLTAALTAISTGMKVDVVYETDSADHYCFARYLTLKK